MITCSPMTVLGRRKRTAVEKYYVRSAEIARSTNVGANKNYIFEAGKYVFGRNMYKVQVDAVYHLLVHGKLLLGQPTGSGKSTVFHLSGILRRGIIILVGPLLALMADQFRKARKLRSPFGKVECFNLDQIKSTTSVSDTIAHLCSVRVDTVDTFFCFSSPQTIQRWAKMIRHIINKKTLRLLANDEYHFNSNYGYGFRPEVNALRNNLYSPYLKNNKDPMLLFMSATNTSRTISDLDTILGVKMEVCFMVWGGAREFLKVNVDLRSNSYIQRKKRIASALGTYIIGHPGRQFIVYSNFASRCSNLRQEVIDLLHELGSSGYVVLLVGDDFSEQKEFSIRAFLGKFYMYSCSISNYNSYLLCCYQGDINIPGLDIVGAVLSVGLGSAGLDNSNLHYGFLNEVPSSVEELAQILGRFGRRLGASPAANCLDITCDLAGFLSMYRRIYYSQTKLQTTASNKKESEYRSRVDLQEVVELLVLNRGCVHARIANHLCCPGSFKSDIKMVKCSACFVCGGKWDTMYLPVRYRPLCTMLSLEIIQSQKKKDITSVIERVWKNKTLLNSIFRVHNKKNIRKHHLSSLFMQLLACKIIKVSYCDANKNFPVMVAIDTASIPTYGSILNFHGMNVGS